jgi:DNA-binding response OmpR family regulator
MSVTEPARVLIVEDEHDLAALMQAVLEDEGYEVEICANGDCFDLVRRFRPSVILCDYMLPAYDGRQILARLRREIDPDVPVVMVSAISHATRNWREWGADDFIPKPFDISRLIAVVERAAGSDALRWTRVKGRAGEQAS